MDESRMRMLLIASFYPPQHAVASLRTHGFATAWAKAGHDVTVLTTAKRADQAGMARPSPGVRVIEVPFRGPWPLEVWRRRRARKRAPQPPGRPGGAATDADVPGPLAGPSASPSANPSASPLVNPSVDLSAIPAVTPSAHPATAAAAAVAATERPTDRASLPVSAAREARVDRIRGRLGIYAARRMPDLTDQWVNPAIAAARAERPFDVALSSSGPYTPHLIGMALRQSGHVGRWVADFRDLWVDNHLGGGVWPFTVRERVLQRRCLAAADMLTTVSDELAAGLRASPGAADTPVEVVHNGFDPVEVRAARERVAGDPDSFWTSLGLPAGARTLVYTGSVHPHGQSAAAIFRAIAAHRAAGPDSRPDVRVVVAGTAADHWRKWATDAGVPDALIHLGRQPRTTALAMQHAADGLLSLAWSGPRTGGLSGKVFEYLAATAPILVVGGRPTDPLASLVTACERGRHLGDDAALIARVIGDLPPRPECGAPELNPRIARFGRPAQAAAIAHRIETDLLGPNRGSRTSAAAVVDRGPASITTIAAPNREVESIAARNDRRSAR